MSQKICGGCGVIVAGDFSVCRVCATSYERALPWPALDKGRYFALLRAGFTCEHCGAGSHLDALEADGRAVCSNCGRDQRFDVRVWKSALEFAKGVGDLGRPWVPKPDGSPGVGVGGDRSLIEGRSDLDANKHGPLEVSVAPGHPLCRCGGLLAVTGIVDNVTSTRCQSCGEDDQYKLPSKIAALNGVVGTVGDAQNINARLGELKQASGTATVDCPSCAANQELPPGAYMVSCKFCDAHIRVPHRTLLKMHLSDKKRAPLWVLFEGKSVLRRKHERGDFDKPNEGPQFERVARGAQTMAPKKKQGGGSKLSWLIALLVIIGTIAFYLYPAWQDEGTGLQAWVRGLWGSETTSEATQTTPPIPSPALRSTESCQRRARVEQSRVDVTLLLRTGSHATAQGPDGMHTTHELGWVVSVGGDNRKLHIEGTALPPRCEGALHKVAFGTRGHYGVVAYGDKASAFDLRTGAPLWTSDLVAPLGELPDHRDELLLSCDAIRMTRTQAQIKTGSRRTYLELSSGRKQRPALE